MGHFHTGDGCDLRLHTDGSPSATLLTTIVYEDDRGRVWVAPGEDRFPGAGTRGDGASVPPIMWPIYGHPWKSDHARAGWLHDRAYQGAEPCTLIESMRCRARYEADRMFYEAIRDDVAANDGAVRFCDLPKWRVISRLVRYVLRRFAHGDDARGMFLGVHLGGWWAWWKHGRAKARARREAAR